MIKLLYTYIAKHTMDSAFWPKNIACEAILKSCHMSLSSEAIDN
jgi:hypothetical protein